MPIVLNVRVWWGDYTPIILGFHIIPRGTKDNRHSGHVGVPNKRNNHNYFVESTTTWPP